MLLKREMKKTFTFNLDFDGTCVSHEFPEVGKDIGAVPVLKELTDAGHKLILFTMRSNMKGNRPTLGEAVQWFKDNDIPLYGIQINPTQRSWTNSNKSYANFIIDDSALGCPLITNLSISERPFVDWSKIREILVQKGIL